MIYTECEVLKLYLFGEANVNVFFGELDNSKSVVNFASLDQFFLGCRDFNVIKIVLFI